jgi:hypothetical protein
MLNLKEYLIEEAKGGLTIFDIDDTLFHTTAKVSVIRKGKVVKELSNQEYNHYQLKDGEEFDFGQFRDAKKFKEESKPIDRMFAKAKAILNNVLNKPDSRVIIVTARDDFDDKDTFLSTFKDHGLDITNVRIERAGKIKDVAGSAAQKMIIIRNYLKAGNFARVRLFDDSMPNLKQFLKLKGEFPDVKFEAFFANKDGSIRTIK